MDATLPADGLDGTTHDVVIIGAGFSGLAMLQTLRSTNIDALLLEAGDDIGGTWSSNRYPGVRTDCEYRYYCLTLSQDVIDTWNWKERFPTGGEVRAYLRHFATRLGLTSSIQLGSRVEQLTWDAARDLWHVTIHGQPAVAAHHVVLATGLLQKAVYPSIAGLESFTGQMVHTSAWPEDGIDLTDKRVGVIGVGSSSVQLIPEIAEQAASVTVFQRTPNYIVPTTPREITDDERETSRRTQHEVFDRCSKNPFGVDLEGTVAPYSDLTEEERLEVMHRTWNMGGFYFLCQTFADLAVNDDAAWAASHFIHDRIREIVTDQDVAETLIPHDYPVGAKRLSTGAGFYEAFNRDNVHLVDVRTTPITSVDESGLFVGHQHYDLDVLVCATGFDALTGSIDAIEIRGVDGELLSESWRQQGLSTYLGMLVSGFPNLTMMAGPHTPAGNIPAVIQNQAIWIGDLLSSLREQGATRVESTPQADRWWAEQSLAAVQGTVMERYADQARAWFFGHNVDGKTVGVNTYFGGLPLYLAALDEASRDGYPSLQTSHGQTASSL